MNDTDILLDTNDDILSSGLIDSIGVMQLITFIEENFNVEVSPEDMVIENFVTIDAMESYIKNTKN